jgi:hypothetical protein
MPRRSFPFATVPKSTLRAGARRELTRLSYASTNKRTFLGYVRRRWPPGTGAGFSFRAMAHRISQNGLERKVRSRVILEEPMSTRNALPRARAARTSNVFAWGGSPTRGCLSLRSSRRNAMRLPTRRLSQYTILAATGHAKLRGSVAASESLSTIPTQEVQV